MVLFIPDKFSIWKKWDIDFLKKEVFGMLLDNTYYKNMVEEFTRAIEEIFANKALIEKVNCLFEFRGSFQICFIYIPTDLKIIIESEIRTFTIMIEDKEGASNPLYRIKKFNNILNENNIKKSLILLNEVLEENQFNLYIYKGDKVYKKMLMVLKG